MTEEIKIDVIQKTQNSLGKFIKKPPLTEKLLKKPPFRFLHDVVTNVIRSTGLLNGLYSDTEMQSENIKDRDSKIAFLQKLIDVMKMTTGTNLTVRASKIVAGLEPAKTNELLQAIGLALEKKLDCSEAIKKVRGETTPKSKSKTKLDSDKTQKTKASTSTTKVKTSPRTNKKISDQPVKERTKRQDSQKSNISPNSKKDVKNSKVSPRSNNDKQKPVEKSLEDKKRHKEKDDEEIDLQEKVNKEMHLKEKENDKEIIEEFQENKRKTDNLNNEIMVDDIKDNVVEFKNNRTERLQEHENVQLQVAENNANNYLNEKSGEIQSNEMLAFDTKNITNKQNTDTLFVKEEKKNEKLQSLEEPLELQNRSPIPGEEKISQVLQPNDETKSSRMLRPPSVRPSSARPGAPRLRERNTDVILRPGESATLGRVNVIVEGSNSQAETTSKQEEDEEETVTVTVEVPLIEEPEPKPPVPVEGSGMLVATILEQIGEQQQSVKPIVPIPQHKHAEATFKLREAVQTLTRTANPLGKLVGYLHEDIDAMRAELQSWKVINENLADEMEKRQANDDEMIKPLLVQLERIQQDIQKQKELIAQTQANVIRNERKIKTLMSGG